jgi:hypothetical protein
MKTLTKSGGFTGSSIRISISAYESCPLTQKFVSVP